MPRANTAANKATVKKADQVMENQLEIPDFNFGQPVKEQPEVNVQVLYKKRVQYHLIIAVLGSLVLILLVLRLLEM